MTIREGASSCKPVQNVPTGRISQSPKLVVRPRCKTRGKQTHKVRVCVGLPNPFLTTIVRVKNVNRDVCASLQDKPRTRKLYLCCHVDTSRNLTKILGVSLKTDTQLTPGHFGIQIDVLPEEVHGTGVFLPNVYKLLTVRSVNLRINRR